MPPPEPPAADGFSDSDQAWYDRLGPAPRTPPQTAPEREGDALRLAIQRADEQLAQRPDMKAAMSDEANARRWQRLQAKLDAEGLLMPGPQAAPAPPAVPAAPRRDAAAPGGWQRLLDTLRGTLSGPRWPAAAGLALVLALGTVVVVQMRMAADYPLPGELKGADDVRKVAVAQPRQVAEAFAAELRAAGLQPGLFQRGRTYIVDIDVAREQFVAATPAFRRVGLNPRLGYTRVEFDPPQAR